MRPIRGRANPWLFFLLAFLWSWLMWLPPIIFGWEWGDVPTLLFYALGFGPLLAALILVHRGYSEESPREFWRRVYDFRRIPIVWLLAIIALPFGLNFLAVLFPAGTTEGDTTALTIGSVIFIVFVFGLGASFAEELGWRGYAIDPLQKTYSALVTGLIVGFFWGIWHLPLFFIEGANTWTGSTLEYVVGATALAIIFTWVYNNTAGSLLVAVMFHATVNFTPALFVDPAEGEVRFYLMFAGLMCVAAFVVVAIAGPAHLAKQREVSTASQRTTPVR
jgi:uncharacterized protein